MQVTDIRIHLMNEERLKAFVSVIFDNCFVVHNIKVVKGNEGLFLCMPSRKTATGEYRDLVHPITHSFRTLLEGKVLKVYRDACSSQVTDLEEKSDLENTQPVF